MQTVRAATNRLPAAWRSLIVLRIQQHEMSARSDTTMRDAERSLADSSQLVLIVANDSGLRMLPLPSCDSMTIGRGEEADIRISDRRVSRRHVRLYRHPSLRIEDLRSANGTWVRRERLAAGQARDLEVGDPIEIGGTILLLRWVPVREATTLLQHERDHDGVGPAMRAILTLADRAAQSNISTLILGETGVGKDVLAERIHLSSTRARQPFLRLNCAALSASLLESELFGHEKGAFTGATAARAGLLQSASGGSVFLDEVGELPLEIQAKLLLVLERREVLPIGSARPRKIDVRFIAATNRELAQEVERGAFRRDLFFRLNGVTLRVPPLRERVDEIDGLTRRFAEEACHTSGRTCPRLPPELLAAFRAYSWPGNIRELRQTVERGILLCMGDTLALDDVGPLTEVAPVAQPVSPAARPPTPADTTALSQEEEIVAALARCAGNQSRAAKLLGISRNTLIARIKKYGLARPLGPRDRD
jgi:DNA-binding NtrC family response regulator